MASTPVIGRDEELGSIESFLAGVAEGPRALVLSGEAGIGKTSLWEAGVEEAERRYGRVLSHRSVEAEALLSFAGLSDLIDPVLEEVSIALAPLRRRALEVALLLAEPGEEPPDPRAIGLALLDVLRVLAEKGPIVVALDDVQWLDVSSAAVLQIALRRLRDERIGLLATLRKVPGSQHPSSSNAPSRTSASNGSGSDRSIWARFTICSEMGSGSSSRGRSSPASRRRPGATLSSRWSSGASWFGRTKGQQPGGRCACQRT